LKRFSRIVSRLKYWRVRRAVKFHRTRDENSKYQGAPLISAIIQAFNKQRSIGKLVDRLVDLHIDEIILIDDGSVDRTLEEALPHLVGKNHFLIHANDIFEVRTYDRALSMARGQFAVLLQDDELPPETSIWLDEPLRLFDLDRQLLILGGRNGLNIQLPDPIMPGEESVYRIKGQVAGKAGENKYEFHNRPVYKLGDVAFQYFMSINRGPMWVRRTPFIEQVGIDQSFAPFQCDDVDSCLRAWKAGWRVGLYDAAFQKFGESGMKLFNSQRIAEQSALHWAMVYQRHGISIQDGTLPMLVQDANDSLALLYETEGEENA